MRWLILTSLIAVAAVPAAAQQPFAIQDGVQPVTVLSPLPDSTVSGEAPLEISLLLEGFSGLELRLALDSTDITARAEVTGDYLYCLLDTIPAAGPHQVTLRVTSGTDTVFTQSWAFVIAAPAAVADTLPQPVSEEGPLSFPPEASLTAGLQYASCDRDTAGLGLTTPTGFYPHGDASISGSAAGGFYNGFLSYDPAYDSYPHGLLQFNTASLKLSLGEFYPELSELAFSGVTPLGAMAAYQFPRLRLDLTGCRTQQADTGLQSFSQYLYGCQLTAGLVDSLKAFAGYLAGFDRVSSLPDSVRYRVSYFIYSDSLLGIADTMVTVDSLHPGKDRIAWAGLSFGRGWLALRGEYATSTFLPDTGGTLTDRSFLLTGRIASAKHSAELGVVSYGDHFTSFGNPYVESSKDEVDLRTESHWTKRFSTTVDGAVYRVASDSTAGNSYRLGAGFSASRGCLASLSLRFDYNRRPYTSYLTQARTIFASAALRWGLLQLTPTYTYCSASSDRLSQSHTATLEGAAGLTKKLQLRLGDQYYQLRDDLGTSDQVKNTVFGKVLRTFNDKNSLELSAKYIAFTDRIDGTKSYRQPVVESAYTRRF